MKLSPEMDIKIKKAHQSLGPKPEDSVARPRSIIVRFSDATAKDEIIQQAWIQKQVFFQDKRIFFDQDYPPHLQKKKQKFTKLSNNSKIRKYRQNACIQHN